MNISFLGLSSSGTSTLNGELITKLKDSETTSLNKNIDKRLSDLDNSKKIYDTFNNQLNSLLKTTIKTSDGYSATTSNDNLNFSVSNKELLKEDFISFNVSDLAKKEVYQTNKFSSENDLFIQGNFSIKGNTIDTTNKSYKDITTELNTIPGVNASIEEVGTNEYRIIVKSLIGTENNLNASLEKIQSSSNLNIKIDGIDYSFSENTFNYNGLQITANTVGDTSINIKKDFNEVKSRIESFIYSFNTLNSFTTDTISNNPEFKINKSYIKDILSDIKKEFFNNNVFTNGISLDKSGNLSFSEENVDFSKIELFLDNVSKTIEDKIKNNKETENVNKTKLDLEKEKQKNIDYLDKKYELMSNQFSAYNRIINSFESNFSVLKNMINLQNSN